MAHFTVTCPHCQALLELDGDKQVVVASKPVEKAKSTTTIEDRLRALSEEKENARAKMEEAFRAEKAGSSIREEKFKKLLESAKDEPVTKPVRDIDLD
ncbi:MAG TPA: hypothetical protein VLW17_14235 [Thermoanaerobaculaceae bacterium]|nr:hypothetical protein [Thermoanaerobaculaceae bacterium]